MTELELAAQIIELQRNNLADLKRRVEALVGHIDVDLDEQLSPEDE